MCMLQYASVVSPKLLAVPRPVNHVTNVSPLCIGSGHIFFHALPLLRYLTDVRDMLKFTDAGFAF